MAKLLDKILHVSPGWFKSLMVSCYGAVEHRKRFGKIYEDRYRELVAVSQGGEDEINSFQARRLKELLSEAFYYSPWYRDQYMNAGISEEILENEDPLSLLTRLPFLEKEVLKSETRCVMSENPKREPIAIVHTSGTSGSPMSIAFDREGRQSTYAEWRRYHDWLGLPEKFRSVRFSGRIIVDPSATKPPFWCHNWVDQQLFMSTYHLKKEYLSDYIKKLNGFRPELIDGYPSALYIVAQYILEEGVKLSFAPKVVSVTAETLMEHQRDAIERAFGCKVYNQYASSEGAPWIVECEEGNYHLWSDTGVFEFLEPRELDEQTDIAELVVTSFRNFKTPLIRYRIGDYVQIFKQKMVCRCEAPYPVIKGVIGRSDDILFTEEKGSIGRLDPVYKGVEGVTQSKIIQHSMDELEVMIVVDSRFDINQENLLIENLRHRLGSSININFTFHDSLPLGKTGKLKSVERRFSI